MAETMLHTHFCYKPSRVWELAGRDPRGVAHCLLVSARNRGDGILVDCQGYNYARYAAYVPDTAALDLRDVPVDHYDLKLRQTRGQRER